MNTILFDLDGTLLPLTQEALVEHYFALLGQKVAALGFDTRAVLKALSAGTGAMLKNDGSMTNARRFWEAFDAHLGYSLPSLEAELEDFYKNEFDAVRKALGPDPGAASLIRALRARGYTLALATNPLFPLVAIRTRLGWLGLDPADFALVTTYENSRSCKPNPLYFREILDKLGKAPEDCLMVGNNLIDDLSALELGISAYLVTDYLENDGVEGVLPCPRGSFSQMREALLAMPGPSY